MNTQMYDQQHREVERKCCRPEIRVQLGLVVVHEIHKRNYRSAAFS